MFADFQMTDEEIELIYQRSLELEEGPTDFFSPPLPQWEPVDQDWFWLYEPKHDEE